MIEGIVMRASAASASWRNRGTNSSMSVSPSAAKPACWAKGRVSRQASVLRGGVQAYASGFDALTERGQ